MTTPQDSTNTTERAPQSSGSPPDEPRRIGPRQAEHHAAQKDLAVVRAHTARELPPSQVPLPGPGSARRGPYTFFKEEVRAGNVEAIYSQGDTVEGRFEEPVTYPPKGEGGSEPGSAFAHLQDLHHRASVLR